MEIPPLESGRQTLPDPADNTNSSPPVRPPHSQVSHHLQNARCGAGNVQALQLLFTLAVSLKCKNICNIYTLEEQHTSLP